jgi:hopanoid-associated phosphorylase
LGDVIVVCGLDREGRVLTGPGLRIIAGGGNAAQLAEALARAAPAADGIISFGMAGALDPAMRIGDWVIGDTVLSSPSYPLKGRGSGQTCDPAWTAALARLMPDARRGPIYADGRLIADPAEKVALGQGGALAADMESHVAARCAAEAGLPFAVLRCISDEAGHAIPPAIAVSMRPDGGLALGAVLRSITRNPGQLPELMRTLFAFNRAYTALRAGAQALGPRLAFDLR